MGVHRRRNTRVPHSGCTRAMRHRFLWLALCLLRLHAAVSPRACPAGASWFGVGAAPHGGAAPCSARGACVDGACACAAAFTGAACARLRCPGWSALARAPCSGHGRCLSLREAGRGGAAGGGGWAPGVAYAAWDADAVLGCACDAGWTGADCSERVCAAGSRPPAGNGAGGAHARLVLSTRLAAARREVQRVSLAAAAGAAADVDEVQRVCARGVSAPPVAGTLVLGFDSRARCALCTLPAAATQTPPVALLAGDPTGTAAALAAALSALANVGDVAVSGFIVPPDALCFNVTFRGADVGGDVPLLGVNGSALTWQPGDAAAAIDVVELVPGSELTGMVALLFDGAGSYPTAAELAAGGDVEDAAVLALAGQLASPPLAVNASAADVAAAVSAVVLAGIESAPPGGAIVVTREGSGGPGLAWRISFAAGVRARGNVAELGSSSSSLAVKPHAHLNCSLVANATVTTLQQGEFLSGSWAASLAYTVAPPPVPPAQTPATAPLSWQAQASDVAAALAALDVTQQGVPGSGGAGLGAPAVTRTRVAGSGALSAAWTGAYAWSLTFTSCSEAVPDPPPPDGSMLGDGAGGLAAASAAAPGVAAVMQVRGGAGHAEVNEVQLLDCRCPACSDPSRHFIRLAFAPLPVSAARRGALRLSAAAAAAGAELRPGPRGTLLEVTPPIAFNASAAAIAAALTLLPSLSAGIEVAQYDASSPTATAAGLCDADGVTTAITFTHAPGAQAPLTIHRSADVTLPGAASGAGGTLFAIRTAWVARGSAAWQDGTGVGTAGVLVRGAFGGRARVGTRALLACSGTGRCNTATGECSCYAAAAMAGGGFSTYGASSGAGGSLAPAAGSVADCGFFGGGVVGSCPWVRMDAGQPPAVCGGAGNGACGGADDAFTCRCAAGRAGGACERAACPASFASSISANSPARAWWDVPTSAQDAHAPAVCSARGLCAQDNGQAGVLLGAAAGACACLGGFRGQACQLSACPPGGQLAPTQVTAQDDTCAGGSACLALRDYNLWHGGEAGDDRGDDWQSPLDSQTGELTAAAEARDYRVPWDALQIRGCACNRTRRFVGSGRGTTTSVYAPAAPATSASSATVGGATAWGGLTSPTGWACSEYSCPGGTDPLDARARARLAATAAAADADPAWWRRWLAATASGDAAAADALRHPYEVQRLTCSATAGSLTVSFLNSSTRSLPATAQVVGDFTASSAPALTFERALADLRNVTGGLWLAPAWPGAPLCGAGGLQTSVIFRTLEGRLPLLRLTLDALARNSSGAANMSSAAAAAAASVQRIQASSLGTTPCSGRGTCAADTGVCACAAPTFISSDGLGRPGDRGDCGAIAGLASPLASVSVSVAGLPARNVI